ncbi:MAG: hypothetical protein EBR82_17485 [Caulobacteraceae bacterium]|nr:hypothetical protein [Caulobacteraceae bacterium]
MKDILRELEPPLVCLLPHGAILELSVRFNKNRNNIRRMLRGQLGNSKNVALITSAAVELIRQQQAEQDIAIKKLGF